MVGSDDATLVLVEKILAFLRYVHVRTHTAHDTRHTPPHALGTLNVCRVVCRVSCVVCRVVRCVCTGQARSCTFTAMAATGARASSRRCCLAGYTASTPRRLCSCASSTTIAGTLPRTRTTAHAPPHTHHRTRTTAHTRTHAPPHTHINSRLWCVCGARPDVEGISAKTVPSPQTHDQRAQVVRLLR
jgi:hypothetical protein